MENEQETFYVNNFEINENLVRVSTEETNIQIKKMSFENQNLLLNILHQEMNTLLDFTGASDYQVYYLSEKHEILGSTYAKNNEKGYLIVTQYKRILLVSLER